jgi:transposase
MSSLRLYVGLDYSDTGVQVCLLDAEGHPVANRDCPNDAAAIAALVSRHGTAVEAALECGTGAADLADELVQRYGWSVSLAHPGYVARIKQSPDKTDYQDARLLADLTRVGYLPRVWLAPEPVRELRRLVRYRQQLVNRRRAVKLQVRALLRDQRCRPATPLRAWTQEWLTWLRRAPVSAASRWLIRRHLAELKRLAADVHAVEQRLAKVTATDAVVQRLVQQPGIGPVTAWTLRAEIGRFDRFRSGKQLARFCGLSPRNASSGQRQADAGLVKAANPALRAVLMEAAHRLARLDPRWRALAGRLKAAGKAASVVIAAVANRWIRRLYYEMAG